MFLLALAVFSSPVPAEPVVSGVSGNVTDGATVTISGSQFGYHSHNGLAPSRNFDVVPGGSGYLCSWWDDFDAFTAVTGGENPMDNFYNFTSGGQNWVHISTSEARGTRSLYSTADGGGAKVRPGPEWNHVDPFDNNGVWYWSMWMFFPANWNSVSPDQWKLVRFFDSVAGHDYYPGINQSQDLGHHSDAVCSSCIGNTVNFFNMMDTVQGAPFRGDWHRIEILTDTGSDELLYYVDGHLYYDGNAQFGSNCFPSTWQNSWMEFFSIDEVHHPYQYNVGYYDDIYANNTWARVEICQTNEFTVNSSRKLVKNLQLPQSWSAGSITVELDLEGLSGTAYLFVVDADGNHNAGGFPVEIGGGQPDTDPPVISDVQATTESATSTSISWTTDEPATSQVNYGTTTSYGQSTTLDPTLLTGHSVTLGGLVSDTVYHYRVRSRDAAGNEAVSGDHSFTTSDTIPPDPPENVDAEAIT
jgi:hypothetical protein